MSYEKRNVYLDTDDQVYIEDVELADVDYVDDAIATERQARMDADASCIKRSLIA